MMRPANPSAPPSAANGLSKTFADVQCRGEDSNLCCIAGLHLPEGNPLRRLS